LKSLFTHNLGLKALAGVIAFFLWMLVTGESEAVRVYPARVEYLYPDDQMLTGESSGSVSVYLRGPDLLLRGLDLNGLSAVVDVRGGGTGPRRIVLDPETHLRGLPPGVAVERISPQIITMVLEKRIRATLPVMPRVEGQPPSGCRFAGYETVPSEVLVEGAESQVKSMAMVQTEPIDLSGRCDPFTVLVSVRPDKPDVRAVSQKPVTVKVRIERMDGA
jgi:YbbR domain-containing protein